MQIITDSSAMYTPEEAQELGLKVIPACTVIGGRAWRDYVDMSSDEFLGRIAAGETPTSSQPSVGEMLEAYEGCDEEAIVLPIGDGLSGTYQNMCGAREMLEDGRRIHVLDTQTLGGPLWYLVQKALKMRREGSSAAEILGALRESIATSASFVIPKDFNFLRRSGRLTPVAAKLGTLLKIVPVLTQTPDRKRITLYAIRRARRKAVESLIERLREMGVNEKYLITVSHGGVKEEAAEILEELRRHFAQAAFRLFTLPPALICHGGPGCILIQTIRM